MDKKLNEVTKVTDMAYVPVIMADGSIGQIAKSDLASVVAGVMNNDKLFPFMGMGKAPSGDLNNVQTPGMYYLANSSEYTNSPGFGWSALIVFKTLYVTQVVFQSTGSQVMSRVFDGNNWSSWYHLDNFGCNSLAELAGGVANVEPLSFLFGATTTQNRGYNSLDDINTNSVMYASVSYGLSNMPFSYCMVMTFINGKYGMQMAISVDGNEMAFRGRVDGKWGVWKKVNSTNL